MGEKPWQNVSYRPIVLSGKLCRLGQELVATSCVLLEANQIGL